MERTEENLFLFSIHKNISHRYKTLEIIEGKINFQGFLLLLLFLFYFKRK
jgi:hypothetical protein